MSTMETPPPPDPQMTPAGPPERRCPRCGSALAPDQEWCLACGAAAGTEVVEARGWRVPLYLGGGLVALAILGVILAIAALSDREEVAGTGTPTPTEDTTPEPSPTEDPAPSTGAFSGNDGDWTVIIASKTSEADAQDVATEASGKDVPAEVLNSDDYSSLNGGYWVVYSGAYATKKEAQDALPTIRPEYSDAYVAKISNSS